MKNEKNKTKKERKTKNQYHPEETVGIMQTGYTNEAWKYLLHLPHNWTKWKQLAHGSFISKGKCGCVFEIRFTNTSSPMLQLQHKPRRTRSRLLRKNVKGNRARKNGRITKRQNSNSKSVRPLYKPDSEVRGNPHGLK